MPDLRRLDLVLEYLPDAGVIETLRARRGRGRNDYPVSALWRALVAGEERPMAFCGFERHYIRGQAAMTVRVGLALAILMALALGHVLEGRPGQMRSLVGPVPFRDTG